jgi:hypothetical protein
MTSLVLTTGLEKLGIVNMQKATSIKGVKNISKPACKGVTVIVMTKGRTNG